MRTIYIDQRTDLNRLHAELTRAGSPDVVFKSTSPAARKRLNGWLARRMSIEPSKLD